MSLKGTRTEDPPETKTIFYDRSTFAILNHDVLSGKEAN